jgi:hypothetical protein
VSDPAADPRAPIAIVAGAGSLPLEVARSAERAGRPVFVAVLAGSGDPSDFAALPHQVFGLGQLGGLLAALKSHGVREASLIGAVVRPGLTDIKPDFGLLRHLPALGAAFRKGDDGLLSAVVAILEEQGIAIRSALDIAPDLAALAPGPLAQQRADETGRAEIALGLAVLEALSPFDVGQAVIVADGRPVAIEGAEGTDGLLQRMAAMRAAGRVRGAGGVLVKAPKRGQNLKVDLPTIGPRTLLKAAEAGLAGVAIKTRHVLIAERSATIGAANQAGLFLEAVA